MKREVIKLEFAPRTRVHRVLFERDSPFKPKVVQDKTLYKRRDKHQKPYA